MGGTSLLRSLSPSLLIFLSKQKLDTCVSPSCVVILFVYFAHIGVGGCARSGVDVFSVFVFIVSFSPIPQKMSPSVCFDLSLQAVQIKGRQFSVRATGKEVKGERRKRKVAKGLIESQINQIF